MSDGKGLRLNTIEIRFTEKYDQRSVQDLMNYVNEIARMNQKFVQLLRGGTVGQVLKKTGDGDLEATWVDP
jgi:hypothetical protein